MNKITALKDFMITIGCKATLNEPMNTHTSFGVGGNADIFIQPKNVEEIIQGLNYLREIELPYLVLGRGSNVLVSDDGIQGAVIQIADGFSNIQMQGNLITADAGTPISKIAYYAYQYGLTGLEFAWGIPGTLGGAVYMNAGAYGGEIKDCIVQSTHITPQLTIETKLADALEFAYRSSFYTNKNTYLITSATLKLEKADKESIYAKMKEHLTARKQKQPLNFKSAGSTFKRPNGAFAGKLIADSGLAGYQVGDAQVSEKHCGFVINKGHATATDIEILIDYIKQEVKRKTGYELECEVKWIDRTAVFI